MAPTPLHAKEGSALLCSVSSSCTGLPKTGATNYNTPRVISEYFCLLCQGNESNCNTLVKKNLKVIGLRVKQRLVVFYEGPFTLVGT